jgi:hypothetical protein
MEDPFLKAIIIGHHKMPEEVWHKAEHARLVQKVLEMNIKRFYKANKIY